MKTQLLLSLFLLGGLLSLDTHVPDTNIPADNPPPIIEFVVANESSDTSYSVYLPLVNGNLIGGSNMVYIPEGEYWYDSQYRWYEPAFYIDKTEVTNAQYALCVEAGICYAPVEHSSQTRSSYFNNPTYSEFPVIHVVSGYAYIYCRWAGKSLVSDHQWVKAARGPDDVRTYPWGDEDPNCSLANSYNNQSSKDCVGDTVKVGSYPAGASPYGVLDMSGNVAEIIPNQNDWRFVQFMNGGYDSDWDHLKIGYYVYFGESNQHYSSLGFRCGYRVGTGIAHRSSGD